MGHERYELVTLTRTGYPWKPPKNRRKLRKFVALKNEIRKD
jgi:hypothetical protein